MKCLWCGKPVRLTKFSVTFKHYWDVGALDFKAECPGSRIKVNIVPRKT